MKIIMRIVEIFICVACFIVIGLLWTTDVLNIGKMFISICYIVLAGLFVLFTETIIKEIN